MAKKVTIQGSNLLQNLNDDWGGVNNSQGSVTPYSGQGASTSVPAGAEWGMNRGEVERFIKSSINAQQSRIGYYVCDNSASTAAKTVVASGYQLATGGCIRIKMNNANTANNVTLNINSTGAKALYYNDAQASASNSWEAGDVLEVYYDGTQYQCASGGGGSADRISYDNSNSGLEGDNVQEAIDEMADELYIKIGGWEWAADTSRWEQGYYATANGAATASSKWIRTKNPLSSTDRLRSTDNNLHLLLLAWNGDTYVGTWNGSTFSTNYDESKMFLSEIDVSEFSSYGYTFRVDAYKNTDITPSTAGASIEFGTFSPAVKESRLDLMDASIENLEFEVFAQSDGFTQSIPARSQIRHLFPTPLVVGTKYHFSLDFSTQTTGVMSIYLYIDGTTTVTDYVKIAEVPSGQTHYEFEYTPQEGTNYQYFGAYNEGVNTVASVEYSWLSDESKFTSLENQIEELDEYTTVGEKYYIEGWYYKDRNFKLTEDSSYGYASGWIEVTPGSTITWNTVTAGPSYMVVAKADMTYSDRWGYNGQLRSVQIKSTEKYVRPSFPLADVNSTWIKDSLGNIIWQPFVKESIQQAIDSLKDGVDNEISSLIKSVSNMGKKKQVFLGSFVNADMRQGVLIPEDTTYAPRRCYTGIMCLPEKATRIYCKVPNGYLFGIYTYTDEPTTSTSSGWLVPSEGLYYDIPDGKFYFCIVIKKVDDTNISASDVNDLVSSGEIEFTFDAADESNVYGRNSEQETIAKAMMLGTTLDTYPKILHISDVHGDAVRFENAMKLADYLNVDVVAFTGDAVANGSRNMAYYIKYVGDNSKTPIYFCLGNHELNGGMPSSTYFIDPLKEQYGYMKTSDTLTDTNYYYHDIAAKNIRLIALDQFSGHYGSQGLAGKIGQEQITWLCNTLASTPANYGVMILMHAPEDVIPKDDTYDKFWQSHSYCPNGMYEADIRPIEKIIDAFITKSTLNLTYTNAQSESVTINADFTSLASGVEFIAYMNGHKHVDQVGYLEHATNLQLNLLVTCGIAYYGIIYQGLANANDCPRGPLGQTQDSVNLYVIDRANGVVKVVRLGAYMRADMTKKDYMAIPYRDANG